jgi:hypothetical protein
MWRPMQIYLYDWWPLRRKGQIYRKLSLMPVEVCRQPPQAPRAGDASSQPVALRPTS